MKYKKIRNYLGSILFSMIIVSCTDLTETVYDQIVTENYYFVHLSMLIGV